MAKILVIDDDKYIVTWIQKLLEDHRYDVLIACSGEEGLQRAKQEKPDLILLDVIMPCLDGYEVLRRLKMDKETRIIPVAMITVLGNTEDRIKAIDGGCEDFISKPIDKQELLARVKSLLRIRFLHDEAGAAREYAESIVNTVREPLIVLDQDLRVVSASRAFYEFFKADPKETVGQLIYDLGNKQWNIPELRELLETILPQKTTFDNYEVEHDFAGVGRRIMLLNARQIQRVLGKERIILLAIEDITACKQLQEKMETSEERFRRAFETSQNVLLLVHKTEGNILNFNESAQKMFGYSKEEFLGKKLWELGVIKSPEEFQDVVAKSVRDGVIHYEEIVIKTKQGLDINGEVFLVDREKVVQCNIRYITERKQAEEALRVSEAFLASIVENIPDMLFVKDAKDLTFVKFNRAGEDLLGFPRKTMIGKSDRDFFPKDQADFFIAEDRSVLKGKRVREIPEEKIHTKDKGGRILHTKKIPLFDDQGKPTYLLGISEDITERKQAEEGLKKQAVELKANLEELRLMQVQLIQSEKMAGIGRLAAAVTHELRNPLMYVTANISLVEQYFQRIAGEIAELEKTVHGAPPECREKMAAFKESFLKIYNEIGQSVKDSQEGCARINDTVGGLLDYARIDSGMMQPADLSVIIDKALEFVANDIRYKCRVEKDLQRLPMVLCNQRELEQVFVNLFVNAAQATEKGGLVKVKSYLNANQAVVEVLDNGTGIAQENLKRMFEPFFTTKKDGEGTGLGLAIVHRIVERHGGTIAVESKAGEGTIFTIKIPVNP
jgi:PAS domain S-box-containing protein